MITDVRTGDDGKLYGKMLGIDIYGKDYEDLKVGAREALQIFFIACEKYGKGIEKELMSMLD